VENARRTGPGRGLEKRISIYPYLTLPEIPPAPFFISEPDKFSTIPMVPSSMNTCALDHEPIE